MSQLPFDLQNLDPMQNFNLLSKLGRNFSDRHSRNFSIFTNLITFSFLPKGKREWEFSHKLEHSSLIFEDKTLKINLWILPSCQMWKQW